MFAERMAGQIVVCLAGLAVSVLSGCSQDRAPPAEQPQQTVTAPEAVDQTEDVAAVGLQAAGAEELAKAIETRRGDVVLVDFWATWCVPCVELFPHTVQLHRELSEQGLAVISVSMDEPENEPEVLDFLTRQGATFPNLISRYGIGPQSVEVFGITDGALPHLKLYDRTGSLQREFVGGQFTPDQIDRAVKELVNKPL